MPLATTGKIDKVCSDVPESFDIEIARFRPDSS
jgi:hypothetical protein